MTPRLRGVKWISLVLPPKEIETNVDVPACKNSHASICEQGVRVEERVGRVKRCRGCCLFIAMVGSLSVYFD